MYKKNNYKHNSGDHKPVSEKAMEKFAALMIKRMEEMEESHWKKGWTGLDRRCVMQRPSAEHPWRCPRWLQCLLPSAAYRP